MRSSHVVLLRRASLAPNGPSPTNHSPLHRPSSVRVINAHSRASLSSPLPLSPRSVPRRHRMNPRHRPHTLMMEVENWTGRCLILGKAGLEFLNGVGKGVETHATELEEDVGGDVHRLLESRDPPLAVSSSIGPVDATASPLADSSSMGSMAAASMRLKLCNGTGARAVGNKDVASVAATPPMN